MGWFADFMFGKQKTEESAQVPVVEQHEQTKDEHPASSASTQSQDSFHGASGAKIIPEVVIDRVEPKPSGDTKQLELWVELRNESQFEVEVRKFEILGQSTEPGRFLKPGESYEVKVYHGDTPRTDAEKKAIVQYKIVENGDYFQSDHIVSYKLETTDNIEYFLPCEMRLIRPVRDL